MVLRARSESPLHQGRRGQKTVDGGQHRVRRALLAFVTTLAINLVGDGLRDLLDPYSRTNI